MAIQNAVWLQIEGKDTRIRMPSMTVHKRFKLFPGNGMRVGVMATGGYGTLVAQLLQQDGLRLISIRLPEKSKPWVTAGRKTTDRPRAMAGLPRQSRDVPSSTSAFSAANSNTEIQRWVHGWRQPTVL